MLDCHAHNIKFTTLWICCDMLEYIYFLALEKDIQGMSNTVVSPCLSWNKIYVYIKLFPEIVPKSLPNFNLSSKMNSRQQFFSTFQK